MESKFIRDVNIIALSLGMGSCIIVWYFFTFSVGLSILIGAAWGCVNLYFLKRLFEEYIKGADRNFLQCFAWLGIKFPLLYLLGFALLKLKFFSNFGLTGGFTLIFLAIFVLRITRAVINEEKRVS
jgi:hypothetical protein